ncbi:MAG: 1-acyl-sn-glycerol-3-phosphate acyltransferase, partial [Treponema sp.]|nr:1-acyl-sn-glycerol-3-phosphate acyltransferase [Treponema sp.]
MKLLIKTVLIFALTGAIILVFLLPGLLAFFFSFLGLRKPLQLGAYKMAQFWARLLIFFTGCSMTVTGRENIPPEGGVCFVSNHVGIFDIILALAYVGRPFGFIAKKELILIPGLDVWIFMLGGLFLDRKKPRSAIRTIKLGIKRIKAGGGILIFPEGTRSRGRGIAPFRSGSLRLATQSDSVIVPVALTGSYDVFEKSHRICAVPVSISFLP